MALEVVAAVSAPVNLEPFNDLKRRVEITRDARFQANLRLERRNKWSYLVISVLSLFVIILSLVPNIFQLSQPASQALLALTIINSVFIIITTFLEASGNFVHKGEQLHRSARKIATVFNKLMLLTVEEREDKEKIHDLQKEYQASLDDCSFNHENMDYDLIKATKPKLFKDRIYQGRFLWVVSSIRMFAYKIVEYSWTIPHMLVVLLTLACLYLILIEGYLGA
ncbi:MAG: SLATT domain-containing protein [Devosia sp.]|uniref:SLATT domain-containing protein n=1 Tax=Devosia sp. TaxID=1871048 RepID=UPI0024C728E7|nr:SLATT domain-containing protein [Devosia sp.]UYN99563.1 MAG: SLATT domain-containing protein [Devosia sp.]